MPELPEVETTVRKLKVKLEGRKIKDVWSDWNKLVKKPKSFDLFKKLIKGKTIKRIFRKGKIILFELSDDLMLLIHQKLTGHLLYGKWKKQGNKWISEIEGPLKEDPMNKFLHLILFLDNGWQVALSDLRKFAKVELGPREEIEKELKELGPDPLEIDFVQFKKRLQTKKGKIKQVLMDQTVISGVGNIYSDEALFESKIHPKREISKMTEEDFRNLYKSLQEVLKKSIKLKGESISDYRTPEGEKGGFDKLRKVYRREGEKCVRCSGFIKRMKIGGRSAYYCSKCQK